MDLISPFEQIVLTMLKERAKITIPLLLGLMLILSACILPLPFEVYSDPRDGWPAIDEVEFFDTLEEALENNLLFEHGIVTVDEVLRVFKGEEYVVTIFTFQNPQGEDIVYAFQSYVKEDEGKFRYSASFSGMGLSRLGHRIAVSAHDGDEIGEIRRGFRVYNIDHQFVIDDTKRFYWGLSFSPNVKYLRVDGQFVDGVIPVELNDEMVYVWYFEDLQTENSLEFRDFNQHNEGEAVITMDPE